jgi:hypothetical protein
VNSNRNRNLLVAELEHVAAWSEAKKEGLARFVARVVDSEKLRSKYTDSSLSSSLKIRAINQKWSLSHGHFTLVLSK